jgi:hypothetical protein
LVYCLFWSGAALPPPAKGLRGLWLATVQLQQGFAAGGMGLNGQFAPQKF